MRFRAVLLGSCLALVSCAAPSAPPQYMQLAADGEEQARRAVLEIRADLGTAFEVQRVEGVLFVAARKDHLDRAAGTVERLAKFLWREYLDVRPRKPVRILCFPDMGSYNAYVRRTWNRDPSTPYGFYLPGERTVVLNLATGTGTLAHEVVHPLIAEDFPDVPTWFNEGFASLFEQSHTLEDGTVRGKVNWRLKGLREALLSGRAVTLSALTRTGSEQFYGDARGIHYATARFLCLWLQEHGRLKAFYREFRATASDDPTGAKALEKASGMPLEELDRIWRAWVEGL